jgi:hypothetical protein
MKKSLYHLYLLNLQNFLARRDPPANRSPKQAQARG